MKNKEKDVKNYIGGQAVMEGVMMKGKTMYALCVRAADDTIKTQKTSLKPQNNKFLKLPIVRGVVAFIDSLFFGTKLIYDSAEMSGMDLKEENPSKFDKWLEKVFGDKLFNVVMGVSVVFGLALAIGIFMLLPVWITSVLNERIPPWSLGIIEGLVRIILFLIYIVLVSKYKEIKRVFQYHGAEHKTINCYESALPLTVENVKSQTRLHKRCGTSFLLIVMIVSMIVFSFVIVKTVWVRILTRLVLVPLVAGLSYEVIRLAGRHDNWFINAISFPGLSLQRITTKEPDEKQIEVAIEAMTAVLEREVYHE